MSKPPEPELSHPQRVHRTIRNVAKRAADQGVNVVQQSAEKLRDADQRHGISDSMRVLGTKINQRLGVSEKYNAASEAVQRGATKAKRIADEQGVTSFVTGHVIEPSANVVGSIRSSEPVRTVWSVVEDSYGATRRVVIRVVAPDLPTYDSYELLQAAKRELNYIAACVLQVSLDESSQIGIQFGRAVTAKVAAATSTAALLALVATFGHAGTGTAIASLSGAAATSATMAWVGSLVGGGVAAGSALTGGLALVVGLAAYKMLASERRAFESLSELEQRVVQSCWMLAAVSDAYQKRPHEFSPEAAGNFLETLNSLRRNIETNMDDLCSPLDGKNAIALRQHVLADFQSAVIQRLERYVSWAHSDHGRTWHESLKAAAASATARPHAAAMNAVGDVIPVLRAGQVETAIGGVFAALLTREPLDESTESRLVLDALRRSSLDLRHATQEELGNYLRSLSPEALRGVASNVKGIYFELWYVEQYNATNEGTYARVFEATNHPGADVEIVDADSGEVIRTIQLKAVESPSPVERHFERYPHVEVAVTDEVASTIDDDRIHSGGVSNVKLEGEVCSRIDDLQNHTVAARAGDAALLALGIASAAELMQMLRGEREFPEAVISTSTKVGTAAGATALTAMLFG